MTMTTQRHITDADRTRVPEFKLTPDARNLVRRGDVVHVMPSVPGKRDGGDATVFYGMADPDGTLDHVVLSLHGSTRYLRPARLRRRAQTKAARR